MNESPVCNEPCIVKNPTMAQTLLQWFLLPDLVGSRIACILSNLLWAGCLMMAGDKDPFAQLMGNILPLPVWVAMFSLLALGQVFLMARHRTNSRLNFSLITAQTAIWIFLTVVFYKTLYPGSLILANSTVMAFLSSWAFVRTETTNNNNMKRWSDGVNDHGNKSCTIW